MTTVEPILAASARRHGIEDEDMLHAFRNATTAWDLDEGFFMLVGPARSGTLLEIGIIRAEEGTAVIVHAMNARSRFLR